MENNDVLEQIASSYNQFAKGEKRIADYIFKYKNIMQPIQINEVAIACNLSKSSITRFCHKLGLKSFSELKWSLSRSLAKSAELTSGENLLDEEYTNFYEEDANIHEEIKPSDSIPIKCKKICYLGMQALAQTTKHIDYDAISKAVELLCNAKNVYCFGQGNSSIIASDAWGRFSCVTQKFHWISDSHMQLYTASLLGADDVVLYFSFSGSIRELVEIENLVRESEAKLILVTHFPNSKGAQSADMVLICGVVEPPKYQGSIAAKIGQLLIVDILFNEYCARNLDQIVENKKRTLNAISHIQS